MRRITPLCALALSLGALFSCDGSAAGPNGPPAETLSEQTETAHFVFHYSPGDAVDSAWQEAFHVWAINRLGSAPAGKIAYYKYATSPQFRADHGRECCYADPERKAVYTLYGRDNHEVVHVYAWQIVARPVSNFLSEGLAVAFQTDPLAEDYAPRWNGEHVHSIARSLRESGGLIPLDDCLETSDFRQFDGNVSYPEAGSFVHYLTEFYGLDLFLDLYRRGRHDDSRAKIHSDFQSVYGFPFAEAEVGWHSFLDGWMAG